MGRFALALVLFLAVLLVVDGLSVPPKKGKQAKRGALGTCVAPESDNYYAPATLQNFGGPLMTQPCTVYLIYYGNQFANLTNIQESLKYFVNNVGTSPWFSYTQALTDRNGVHITNQITYGTSVNMPQLMFGPVVDQGTIINIVNYQLTQGNLPVDVNAQYYVLNGDDTKVTADGSTADYCGYHSIFTFGTTTIKYGFIVGDKVQLAVCTAAAQGPYSQVVNSAVTTIAHEIIETLSDPLVGSPGGYQTSVQVGNPPSYYENGDMCAFVETPTLPSTNGNLYTTVIGNRQYLIQANLNPQDNCCGFPTGPPQASGTDSSSYTPDSVSGSLSVGASPSNTLPVGAVTPTPTSSRTAFPSYYQPSNAPTNTYDYYYACGNGVIDAGEECDPGDGNFGGATCCNVYCQIKKENAQCGTSAFDPTGCVKEPHCHVDYTVSPPSAQCISKNRKRNSPCVISGSTKGKCHLDTCVPL